MKYEASLAQAEQNHPVTFQPNPPLKEDCMMASCVIFCSDTTRSSFAVQWWITSPRAGLQSLNRCKVQVYIGKCHTVTQSDHWQLSSDQSSFFFCCLYFPKRKEFEDDKIFAMLSFYPSCMNVSKSLSTSPQSDLKLVQLWSERLRVRSRRSATFTPSAQVRRQSLPVWPPTLIN